MTKTCSQCNTDKPLDDFYIKAKPSTYDAMCKPCRCQHRKEYVAANKEKVRQQKAGEWSRNREKRLAQKKEYRQRQLRENPEEFKRKKANWYFNGGGKMRHRNGQYLKRYGITIEDYDELLAKQHNCCAICPIHISELDKPLYVDHDHATGEVRGLLCPKCNFGIGQFQDSTELLEKAIEYLEKTSKPNLKLVEG